MAQSRSRTMMALGLVLCLPLASAFLRLANPEPSVTSRPSATTDVAVKRAAPVQAPASSGWEVLDRTGFFCPFEASGVRGLAPRAPKGKPILLYLPGLEGSGLTAFVQYPDLAGHFELRCLTIPNSDRSTFNDLIRVVREELKVCRGRDVFIMGESFGGLLALGTALDTLKKPGATGNIKGVVLVNPATSFSRTMWAKLGRYLTRLPKPLYTLSMLPVGMLLVDAGQIKSTVERVVQQVMLSLQVLSDRVEATMELSSFHLSFYKSTLPMLIQKLDLLPPDTLDWRLLHWLNTGSEMVEPQLHRISYPVLVVAGTVDRLLPSYEEAQRLKRELAKCSVHYAMDMGHGGTLDQRTNLTQVLRDWGPVKDTLSGSKDWRGGVVSLRLS